MCDAGHSMQVLPPLNSLHGLWHDHELTEDLLGAYYLCDAYDALVREHLGSSRLRAEGLSRNATWLDACKDRGLFRGLCNTT